MQPPALYKTLLSKFGEQHWWPADKGPQREFEIATGAILTQNNPNRRVYCGF